MAVNIAWLEKRKIQFPAIWKKRGYAKKLKELVKKVKEEDPNYNAEVMARKYGHTILRLPRKKPKFGWN